MVFSLSIPKIASFVWLEARAIIAQKILMVNPSYFLYEQECGQIPLCPCLHRICQPGCQSVKEEQIALFCVTRVAKIAILPSQTIRGILR